MSSEYITISERKNMTQINITTATTQRESVHYFLDKESAKHWVKSFYYIIGKVDMKEISFFRYLKYKLF